MNRTLLNLCVAGWLMPLSLLTQPLLAAEPASGPVRLVVGFPPGGGTDGAARIIAEALPQHLGQAVIVENRAGAAGTLGAQYVMRAAPDGQTLFFGTGAEMLINPVTRKKSPYDLLKDFVPITEVGGVTFLLVVPASSRIDSVSALVKAAQDRPGKLNFSSFGQGSTNHMIGELFLSSAQVSAEHIPYQGSSQAMTALLAGDIDFAFDTVAVTLPHIRSGKLRALATPSAQRLADLSGTPTMKESGLPAVEAEGWMGVFAPAGTPPDMVARIHQAVADALRQPELRDKLTARGVTVDVKPPQAFRDMLSAEVTKWRKVATQSHISLD